MLSRNPPVKKIAFDLPNDDMDEDGFTTAHVGEITDKDDTDIKTTMTITTLSIQLLIQNIYQHLHLAVLMPS
eukprot:6028634-Ditylum_brightwellii.AAC.1